MEVLFKDSPDARVRGIPDASEYALFQCATKGYPAFPWELAKHCI